MKKHLALASALLASGAAFAQSSVTLYGLADVYVASRKDADTGDRTTAMSSGGVYQTRFGLKGSEDLGGGLKANFQYEHGFALENGGAGSTGFSRQSWVGLSGAFGEVRAGRAWSAFDDISGSTLAAKNSLLAPNQGTWLTTSYKDNPDNGLYYATPEFGGVSGAVSYGRENASAGAGRGSVASLNVKYGSGPVFAALGYQTEKANGDATALKYTRLSGSYDLGMAKLLASYGRVAFADASTTEWQLGADVPLGGGWLLSGGLARSKGEITGFSGDANYTGKLVNVGPEVERTGYSIAAFYSLSKRTSVYGGYRANKIKTPGAADKDGDVFALGLLHMF